MFCLLGTQTISCTSGFWAVMKLDVRVLVKCFNPGMTDLQELKRSKHVRIIETLKYCQPSLNYKY